MMNQLVDSGAVGVAGSSAVLNQFGYGAYAQYGQGQSFVDANGDVWMIPFGSATPIKIGVVHVQGTGSQVVFPSQMPVQWVAQPAAPVPADLPPPAADPSSWIRALDMMQAEKKRKQLVRCEPDLLEAWND